MKKELVPKRAVIPIITAMILHLFTYYLPKIIVINAKFINVETPLDEQIPFIPFFIIFYIGAFLQWGLNYYFLAWEKPALLKRFIIAELIGKGICAVIFILWPTAIERPEVTGTDIFSRLTAIIFFFDTPDNIFPSIHCLQSWICMRAALKYENTPRWLRPVAVVFTMLVIASVVLVKQHHVLDILPGILLAELGLLITGKMNIRSRYEE